MILSDFRLNVFWWWCWLRRLLQSKWHVTNHQTLSLNVLQNSLTWVTGIMQWECPLIEWGIFMRCCYPPWTTQYVKCVIIIMDYRPRLIGLSNDSSQPSFHSLLWRVFAFGVVSWVTATWERGEATLQKACPKLAWVCSQKTTIDFSIFFTHNHWLIVLDRLQRVTRSRNVWTRKRWHMFGNGRSQTVADGRQRKHLWKQASRRIWKLSTDWTIDDCTAQWLKNL